MNKFYKKAGMHIISIFFWLSIWEILSRTLNADFIFPSIQSTFKALIELLGSSLFYKYVAFSLFRVVVGFVLGIIFGLICAFLSQKFEFIHSVISPMMSVIKATPVASFIMVLWCFIGGTPVPTVIGTLMVSPIIYHNMYDALNVTDSDLAEVCYVFNVQGIRKVRYFLFPRLLEFFIPSAVSGMGLCWKASIAAEIIAYTKNSIGKEIYNSKVFLEGEKLFAYTLVVILLSLLFERIMLMLGEVIKKKCHLK